MSVSTPTGTDALPIIAAAAGRIAENLGSLLISPAGLLTAALIAVVVIRLRAD